MAHPKIEVIKGDIVEQHVDAIVNAANNSLLGGGGVDGAIHKAAGPQLLEECRALGGCETGEAKVTRGYNLPAKWVIHTVGPIWKDGKHGEDELLKQCYTNSLNLAVKNEIKTIAFPSISTGVYHFPVTRAAKIAIKAIHNFLLHSNEIENVMIVCYNNEAFESYMKSLEQALNSIPKRKE
ncbi:O-acetyl-ADP-ribose deacetylase (regulator of RNase III) [Methanohalophilus levihalophilus]|uniref:O-acetyl-ADP-ribose deacetylase n=1 Tax=Methanohalophilus levihalophilus TaxID=1431282 RepID=UPI001AE2ECF5|nr:O-acetyl-ADP-ribose deacetylase [Methanohalophilus levihalophilus]MBP2029769.1 O-acetyl-ADP-ribose deacetylase (regulator of RNase III) [Methanohalophilus levihalophilus]